ncbi:MAG: hypothetical protein LQ347_003666 [Umbilicaria vellea]|nr:MAG: hypothetical protein LQ347_003666 [Umbilicaria vellea]
MQTKAVVAAAVLSAGTLVASLNIIPAFPDAITTGITGYQISKLNADESSYESAVRAGAAYTSYSKELATAVPSSVLAAIKSLATDNALGPEFSSVLSLLPSDVQSFYVSYESQVLAIATSDLSLTAASTASTSGSTTSTTATTSGTTTASGSNTSTAATSSGTTTASGVTTSTSAQTSSSTTSSSAKSSVATVTTNAGSQSTAGVMAPGAVAAVILGFVVLL